MRWRIALVAIIAAMVASCGYGDPPTGSVQEATSTSISKVRQGAGSADASADVKLGPWKRDVVAGEFLTTSGTLEITNHSGKASSYYIEVRLTDGDGTQIDTPAAVMSVVEPGQKARTKWVSVEDPGESGKVTLLTVQRTAA